MSTALPCGAVPAVRWVSSAQEYAEAAAQPAGGLVPRDGAVLLLRPAVPEQERLWSHVLATQFDPTVPAGLLGDRLVASWGAEASAVAAGYAAASGSRLVHCSSARDVVNAVAADGTEPVVVLTSTRRLRVGAVAGVLAAAEPAGRPVGFLFGRTAAALSFAAAKALLAPRAGLGRIDVFDAPSHRAEQNRRRSPADLPDLLRRPALAKILRSHGEGGHAKLADLVVCGLLDDTEFPGVAHAGCARLPRRCKRSAQVGGGVLFGTELAAPVICFLCCNGFNVAGELYPSQVSMSSSFAEGWAAAAIAPLRALVVPDTMVETVRGALAAGKTMGEVVAGLNQLAARLGQPRAFVLSGDPRFALPASRPDPGRAGPGRTDAERLSGSGPVSAGEHSAGPGELALEVGAVQAWLVRVLRRAELGRRLVRAAEVWLGEDGVDAVQPLAERLHRVERLALYALKWAESDPAGASWQRLMRNTMLIRLSVTRWDASVARLLLHARESLDPFDIGHYDQLLAGVEAGPGCRRCGTPLEVQRYGLGDHPDHAREAVLCWVCGPLSERRTGGPGLTVTDCAAAAAAGTSLVLRAKLDVPDGTSPVVERAQVSLRFFDKASGGCVHEESRSVPATSQTLDFHLDLPERLGTDLHSLRLAAVCGFDVAYARVRLAGLPAAGAHR